MKGRGKRCEGKEIIKTRGRDARGEERGVRREGGFEGRERGGEGRKERGERICD